MKTWRGAGATAELNSFQTTTKQLEAPSHVVSHCLKAIRWGVEYAG